MRLQYGINGHCSHTSRVHIHQLPHDVAGKACLMVSMESYQSDICHFRAMTMSPLHLVVNWPVFAIYYFLTMNFSFCAAISSPGLQIGTFENSIQSSDRFFI